MELLQTLFSETNLTRFSLLANPILSTTLVGISIFFLRANITAIKNQNDNAIRSERNEQFKNAIDQLGSENNAIALGGIYTLHRIAKEDESYRENVFNILCSFVREVTTTDDYKEKYNDKPSEPIQTILNILCINKKDFKIYKEYKINFSGVNLAKANLIRANLIDADLIHADLRGVHFGDANLTNAFLPFANITNTYLRDADLTGVDLQNANLISVSLKNADLTNANLSNANLTSIRLSNANLTNADLSYTNLTGANLLAANLTNANLECARLNGTNALDDGITGADLNIIYLNSSVSPTGMPTFLELFEKHIIAGIGKPTDLSSISGGYDEANPPFKGKPITGKYTEEEAKEMIENYYNNLK